MVVAVGDDQPALGIELECVRVRDSPRPVPVLPMVLRNFPFLSNTEMRPTRLGAVTFVWLSATYTSPTVEIATPICNLHRRPGVLEDIDSSLSLVRRYPNAPNDR